MDILTILYEYGVPFLVVLTVLVFVHEFGHYWVARRNGVRIEVFSIGFGPELFGWTDRAQTRWKFSAIPLGGYVKMFGEQEFGPDGAQRAMTEEERAVSFHAKRLGQRAAIVAAGPVANFLFAIVVLAGLYSIVGQPSTPPVVGGVQAGTAAAAAGLEAGDLIVRIDGQAIDRFEEVQQIVRLNRGTKLDIVVLRDGRELGLQATPRSTEMLDANGQPQQVTVLGISSKGVEYKRYDPATALWQAVKETGNLTARTLEALGQMIVGQRDADELGGPLRIAQMSGDFAKVGLVTLIWFTALLSINLGLLNLFPVPMLDGGHLMFYAMEAVRGRPMGERAQEYGFRIGMVLVICLMIFATYQDFDYFNVIERLKRLVS